MSRGYAQISRVTLTGSTLDFITKRFNSWEELSFNPDFSRLKEWRLHVNSTLNGRYVKCLVQTFENGKVIRCEAEGFWWPPDKDYEDKIRQSVISEGTLLNE